MFTLSCLRSIPVKVFQLQTLESFCLLPSGLNFPSTKSSYKYQVPRRMHTVSCFPPIPLAVVSRIFVMSF